MIAFFAATPFQVFNCINIKMSMYKDEEADLYLLSFAADLSSLVDVCRKSGIFSDVEYLNEPYNTKGKRKLLLSYLFPDKPTVKAITRKKYDEMFFSRIGNAASFYYTYISRNNPDVRCNYYDEGMSDYITSIVPAKTKFSRIMPFLRYKSAFAGIEKLWLYMPELRFENKRYTAAKIPDLDREKGKKLLSVFGIGSDVALPPDCKLIYMDQPFLKQQDFDVDDRAVLSVISSVIPKESIYIKIHPCTTDASRYRGYKILPDLGGAWEVVQCAVDVSNTILVAVDSTAVITPNYLFGREPDVIMLYELFKDKPFVEGIEMHRQFFSGMRNRYKDKGRFCIPDSEVELKEALERMTKQ